MSKSGRLTSTLLHDMLANTKIPLMDLDMAFWAYSQKYDWPLAHYDEETYWSAREEGQIETRAVTYPFAALNFLKDEHPKIKTSIETDAEQNCRIEIQIAGYGMGVSGLYKGKLAFDEIGRGIAHAVTEAHEKALDLKKRIDDIHDISNKVPPMIEWPIEELSPGKFFPVCHDFQVAAIPARSPETAAEYLSMNHTGDYGLMICRERYKEVMPDPTFELTSVDRKAEEALGYPYSDQTCFQLRIEFYPKPGGLEPSEVVFVENLTTLKDAQIAYMAENAKQGLSTSRFMPGDVFDQSGEHIARISYNGRLWAPEPLLSGGEPVAEAPKPVQKTLRWMVGTPESVLKDGYIDGLEGEPDVLSIRMNEGDILIGKDRSGNVCVVREKGPDGMIDIPGGLDDLRARLNRNDGPEF